MSSSARETLPVTGEAFVKRASPGRHRPRSSHIQGKMLRDVRRGGGITKLA